MAWNLKWLPCIFALPHRSATYVADVNARICLTPADWPSTAGSDGFWSLAAIGCVDDARDQPDPPGVTIRMAVKGCACSQENGDKLAFHRRRLGAFVAAHFQLALLRIAHAARDRVACRISTDLCLRSKNAKCLECISAEVHPGSAVIRSAQTAEVGEDWCIVKRPILWSIATEKNAAVRCAFQNVCVDIVTASVCREITWTSPP